MSMPAMLRIGGNEGAPRGCKVAVRKPKGSVAVLVEFRGKKPGNRATVYLTREADLKVLKKLAKVI